MSIEVKSLYDLQLVGKFLYFLEDKNNTLTIEQIQSPFYQTLFKPYYKEVFTSPPTLGATWLKIEITNKTLEDTWLNIGTISAWYIDFYKSDSVGKMRLYAQMGIMRPDKNKPYPTHTYWLPLNKAGEKDSQTFYIKLQSQRTIEAPFYVGTLHALHKQKAEKDFIFAAFMGIMLVMFFYNFFVYLVVKDKIYLIYSCHLFFVTFSTTYLSNYNLFHWFCFIPYTFWQDYYYVWLPFASLFIGIFAIQYLELYRNLRVFYYVVVFFLGVHCLFFPVSNVFFLPIVYLAIPYQLAGFLLYLSCLTAGFILHFKKNRKASYYILGWSFVLLGVLTYLLTLNGIFSVNFITENSLFLGITFEVFLFSLALGDRINQIRKENTRLMHEQNTLLERKVEERTLALQRANDTKDKLFAIIGHDLKSPINSLKALLDLSANDNITQEEFTSISKNLRNSVENIHFTLNNLLEWANGQMEGIETLPKAVHVYELVHANLSLFYEIAQDKYIAFYNEVPKDAIVWADENQLNLVLRNLISNALKFTYVSGTVTISYQNNNNRGKIAIQDTGTGISPENIAKLFNPNAHFSMQGTKGEKGTGLGLALCKDFIERNGGTISVESNPEEGTTFFLDLPLPA
jgi:signal transduction histidine kinase